MAGSKQNRAKQGESPAAGKVSGINILKNYLTQRPIHRIIVYILFYAVLFFTMLSPFLSKSVKQYRTGDIADETVVNDKFFRMVNKNATENKKRDIRKKIAPVVDIDMGKQEHYVTVFQNIFSLLKRNYSDKITEKINQYLKSENISLLEKETVKQLCRYKFSTDIESLTIKFMISLLESGIFFGNPENLIRKQNTKINVRKIIKNEKGSTDITYLKKDISSILQYPFKTDVLLKRASEMFPKKNSDYLNVVVNMVSNVIKPNLTINQVMTEQNISQILSHTKPVYIILRKGEKIIERGQQINANDLIKLKYYRKYIKKKDFSVLNLIGIKIFLILFTILIIMFLNYTHKRELQNFRNFFLVYFFIIANIIIIHGIFKSVPQKFEIMISLLIPIGITSICLSILISNYMAMSVNFVLSFIFLVVLLLAEKNNFISFFIFLNAGGLSIFAVRNIKRRTTIFRAAIFISISNLILISAFTLIYKTSLKVWYQSALFGLANGITCSVVAIGIMPFFENVLKIPTSFKLMELADLNTPVLKDMLIDAPGTYHHSLMVANLAESAAEDIGVNALLTRVGAIYHDIGKIGNGKYFSENQLNEENPHDKLTPSLSASIIKSHVKNGVEKAIKLKLPHEIIDFIKQHHGTSTIRFFFEKARIVSEEDAENTSLDIENYRYDGPKPLTKETAIVMLADSVEAASKTLQKPSPIRIKQLITEIINTKFTQEELSQSGLTLNELRIIIEAFYKILAGVFHTRIEYPQNTAPIVNIFQEEANDIDENRDETGNNDTGIEK